MQFEDGAWRNRKQYVNGRQQTGLFLPPDIKLSEKTKQFYLSALDVFDVPRHGLFQFSMDDLGIARKNPDRSLKWTPAFRCLNSDFMCRKLVTTLLIESITFSAHNL
jgi:hypothetical protein